MQSLSQRMEKPFETEGAGEGEISLIARLAPQAGLFGELKAHEAGAHSKMRQKKKKWTRGDLNPRPSECESDALPSELRAHVRDWLGRHVGTWSESLKVYFFFFFFFSSPVFEK